MAEKDQIENFNEEDIDDILDSEELDEQTAAAASLKPGATKSELLSKLISMTAGMTKQDLSSFLEKTLVQVGKEADSIPAGSAAKNKNSISASGVHPPAPINAGVWKEDVDEMFGSEELSEEFKTKATTIFEAAVNNRVALEVARIEEEFENRIEEELTNSVAELHEKVDEYLNYVVNEWVEENQVEIDAILRTEITEDFIDGLKQLFAESYMEVPEDKMDAMVELASQFEEMQEEMNSIMNENMELKKLIEDATKDSIFDEITDGMTDTDAEKFKTMSEGIEYSDMDEFAEKLNVIKESYFTEKTQEKESTQIINEENAIMHEGEGNEVTVPAEMRGYVEAISRTSKRTF